MVSSRGRTRTPTTRPRRTTTSTGVSRSRRSAPNISSRPSSSACRPARPPSKRVLPAARDLERARLADRADVVRDERRAVNRRQRRHRAERMLGGSGANRSVVGLRQQRPQPADLAPLPEAVRRQRDGAGEDRIEQPRGVAQPRRSRRPPSRPRRRTPVRARAPAAPRSRRHVQPLSGQHAAGTTTSDDRRLALHVRGDVQLLEHARGRAARRAAAAAPAPPTASRRRRRTPPTAGSWPSSMTRKPRRASSAPAHRPLVSPPQTMTS